LAAKSLDSAQLLSLYKNINIHIPVGSSVIFEIMVILPAQMMEYHSSDERIMTNVMKWVKYFCGSVPAPSCLTNSCSTYAFQSFALPCISIRVKGWRLCFVGLFIHQRRGYTISHNPPRDDFGNHGMEMIERAVSLSYRLRSLDSLICIRNSFLDCFFDCTRA